MKSISMLSVGSFVATPTGLIVNGSPSFDEWLAYGKHLQVINQSLQMLIGDWLNEGEKRYGETYTQATNLFPENALSTIKNWKWVSGRVEKSARIDGLHYSHYLAVASVEGDVTRKAWLKEAKEKGWSSHMLQEKVNPKPTAPPVTLREALLAIGDSLKDARGMADSDHSLLGVRGPIRDAETAVNVALNAIDLNKKTDASEAEATALTETEGAGCVTVNAF